MPYKSKSQRRFMYWAEAHGKVPQGTAETWEEHTPKGKPLPERLHKEASAFWIGFAKCASAGPGGRFFKIAEDGPGKGFTGTGKGQLGSSQALTDASGMVRTIETDRPWDRGGRNPMDFSPNFTSSEYLEEPNGSHLLT